MILLKFCTGKTSLVVVEKASREEKQQIRFRAGKLLDNKARDTGSQSLFAMVLSRSVFLTRCIGNFLRHNLPLYLSGAVLFLHSFLCNSPDELRTKNLLRTKIMTNLV